MERIEKVLVGPLLDGIGEYVWPRHHERPSQTRSPQRIACRSGNSLVSANNMLLISRNACEKWTAELEVATSVP